MDCGPTNNCKDLSAAPIEGVIASMAGGFYWIGQANRSQPFTVDEVRSDLDFIASHYDRIRDVRLNSAAQVSIYRHRSEPEGAQQ